MRVKFIDGEVVARPANAARDDANHDLPGTGRGDDHIRHFHRLALFREITPRTVWVMDYQPVISSWHFQMATESSRRSTHPCTATTTSATGPISVATPVKDRLSCDGTVLARLI